MSSLPSFKISEESLFLPNTHHSHLYGIYFEPVTGLGAEDTSKQNHQSLPSQRSQCRELPSSMVKQEEEEKAIWCSGNIKETPNRV